MLAVALVVGADLIRFCSNSIGLRLWNLVRKKKEKRKEEEVEKPERQEKSKKRSHKERQEISKKRSHKADPLAPDPPPHVLDSHTTKKNQ